MMIELKTNILDRINFLGIRIWDFALRSLNREYSWFFLFKIVFKYPLKSLRGFLAYKKFCKFKDQIYPQQIYSNISPDELLNEAKNNQSSLLVAMGYCQRPFKTEDQPFQCPSERFSHDCYYTENYNNMCKIPPACSICEIKPIAELALEAGASFHIMTSAMDIARDIFIPTLEKQRFRFAILFICPYSILPITLPLFICGIKFIIIPYTIGDCRNYGDFVRADVGIKPKRTFPIKEHHDFIVELLNKLRIQKEES
jgi:hypothetical protein